VEFHEPMVDMLSDALGACRPAQLPARSFTIDGEACVFGPDAVAIFDALHR
jgi:hypothetical protein